MPRHRAPNVIKMVPLMLCEFYLNSKRETETTTERERKRTKRREEKEGKSRKKSMEARDRYPNEVCSGDPSDWEGAREGF